MTSRSDGIDMDGGLQLAQNNSVVDDKMITL